MRLKSLWAHLPDVKILQQWAYSGLKSGANQRVLAIYLPKMCPRREAPVAYDNGNERNAAHVNSTATVLLPRTLRPNLLA